MSSPTELPSIVVKEIYNLAMQTPDPKKTSKNLKARAKRYLFEADAAEDLATSVAELLKLMPVEAKKYSIMQAIEYICLTSMKSGSDVFTMPALKAHGVIVYLVRLQRLSALPHWPMRWRGPDHGCRSAFRMSQPTRAGHSRLHRPRGGTSDNHPQPWLVT